MPSPQERDVRLLVPNPSRGASVVVDADGRLPSFHVTLDDGATTVAGVCRDVLPRLGLRVPIIDCFVDQLFDPTAGPIPALVEVEPPPRGWVPPAGCTWRDAADVDVTVTPGLHDHVTQLLEERRGRRRVPELRPLWCNEGWYARASAWIESQLADLGRPQPIAIRQIRHWGISAVMKVELPGTADCWFKAVIPHFRAEPTITAFLDREASGTVAPVLAIEPHEGWLLLEDVGDDRADAHVELHGDVIGRLVTLQRAFIGRTDELAAASLPRRSLHDLPDAFAAAISSPAALETLGVDAARVHTLAAWLRAQVDEIDALGYPETLVHGDFHPGNVAIAGRRPLIFDWSDGAIAHPLIDAVTWTWWYEDDADRVDEIWRTFLDGWADLVPPGRFSDVRQTFTGIASAYHAVSYAGIANGLEPTRRVEHVEGLTSHFGKLDAAASGESVRGT